MKFLHDLVNKVKPNFMPGGKFAFLEFTFDAFETFLFVPDKTTSKGSHIRDVMDSKRVMIVVVLALVPALLFGMYNIGLQHFVMMGQSASFFECGLYGLIKMLPMIVVSYGVGLGIEFAFAQMRRHEVSEGFLVSGMLIPMIMPVDVPLWILALSTAFAVIIGKEVFGGTGMNIVNPALLARAFAFFAYTPAMSGTEVWVAQMQGAEAIADGFTGATALEQLSVSGTMSYSVMDAFWGFMPGSAGETSTAAILLGALILLFTGVASWRTMFSVFAGGYAMALVFNAIGANAYMDVPAHWHLVVGGFAFGAVFMATDPVTSAQTNTGKYIVGFMTGLLAILIRVVNPAYPEGMMLAILFMNVFAPLVDHYVVEANIARRRSRIKAAK